MQSNDQPPEYFDQLWENFLLGSLSDNEKLELLNWLEKNPHELERRRDDAALSAGMAYLLSPPHQTQQLILSVQARLKGAKPGVPSGKFARSVMQTVKRKTPQKLTTRKQFFWPSLAAAVLLVGLLVFYTAWNRTPNPLVEGNPQPKAPSSALAVLTIKSGTGSVDGVAIVGTSPVELKNGGEVRLDKASQGSIRLSDGSMLDLKENVRLQLTDLQNRNCLTLLHGRVEIEAQPQKAERPLTLVTPHSTVAVIGTHYTIDTFEAQTLVTVERGKVSVVGKVASDTRLVGAGEQVIVDSVQVSDIRSLSRRRVLPIGDSVVEIADPVTSKLLPGESFMGEALRRLEYHHQKNNTFGFCGVRWPVKLAPDEGEVEVWIRLRSMKPFDERCIGKVTLLMQMGDTEYRVGAVILQPKNRDWFVLRGKLAGAPVNWQRTGTEAIPRKSAFVTHIALRPECPDMEFDHTSIIIPGSADGR